MLINCQCLKHALGEELGCDQLLMRKKLMGHVQKLKLEAKSDANETWFFLAVIFRQFVVVGFQGFEGLPDMGIGPLKFVVSPRTWPCHRYRRPIPLSRRSPRRSPRRSLRPSSRLCAMAVQALRRKQLHQRLHQWKYNTIRSGAEGF